MAAYLAWSSAAPRRFARWREAAAISVPLLGITNPATWALYTAVLNTPWAEFWRRTWPPDGPLCFWLAVVFGTMSASFLMLALALPARFPLHCAAQAVLVGVAVRAWHASAVCEGPLLQHPASKRQVELAHGALRALGMLFMLPAARLAAVPYAAQCRGVLAVLLTMLGFVLPLAVTAALQHGAYVRFRAAAQGEAPGSIVGPRVETARRWAALAVMALMLAAQIWDCVMKVSVLEY